MYKSLVNAYKRLIVKLRQRKVKRGHPPKVVTAAVERLNRVYRLAFPWCPRMQRHVNYEDLADVFVVYEARHFTQYKLPPTLGHNRHGNVFWVEHEGGQLILRAIWKD